MTGIFGRWYGRRSLAICQLIRKFGSRVTGDRMAGISGRGYDDIWSSSGWWMYQVGFSLLITLCQSHQSLCDTKLCHNARYIYARIRMRKSFSLMIALVILWYWDPVIYSLCALSFLYFS